MNERRLLQAPRLDVDVKLLLNEKEIRALDALAGYGIKPFLDVFYKHMGRHYLEPHEQGLRSLFEVIQSQLPQILNRADNARKAFVLADPVIRSREDHDALVQRIKAEAKTQ
jgi:hypothetical protein